MDSIERDLHMSFKNTHYVSIFVPSVLLGFVAALQLTGCSDAPAGLPSDTAGAGGEFAQGGADAAHAGASSKAGASSNAGASGKAGAMGKAGANGKAG